MPTDAPAGMEDFIRDFVITSEEQDRYRDVVDVDGWDWTDYFRGGKGVVLLSHDKHGLPMGSCPWIKTISKAQVGRCEFPTQTQVGYEENQPSLWKTVRLLYINGIMKNTSVGFMADEWTFDEKTGGLHFIKQSGLEWSLCSVPANPGCYALAKSVGIDVNPLRQWAMRSLDMLGGTQGVYVTRSRLEAAMKALGSEKGIAYFDIKEILMADPVVPTQKQTSGWVEEPAEPKVQSKKREGGVRRALEAAGLTVDDLVAMAKSAIKKDGAETAPAVAAGASAAALPAATPEPAAPAPGSVPAAEELTLDLADESTDEIELVDETGKSVSLSKEQLTHLVKSAFTDGYNDQQTRLTGKVH